MQHLLAAVQMLDELGDAAVIFELGSLVPPVFESVVRSSVSVMSSPYSKMPTRAGAGQRVKVVFGRGKDAPVRQEANLGPRFLLAPAFFSLLVGSPLE